MRVWKYPLGPTTVITVTCSNEIAHVGEQNGELFVWVILYDDDPPMIKRKLFVLPTGREYFQPDSRDGFLEVDFLGTVQMKDGLVFHVFEDLREEQGEFSLPRD